MRDVRIDLLRGYAMITIALNHLSILFRDLGLKQPRIPTLTEFGFSSAAEIFFLLSGYMVGMVYLGRPNLKSKLWNRAFEIYAYNAAAFVAAMLIAWVASPLVAAATEAAPTISEPFGYTLQFLMLLQHPDLLGVLSLYVLFMLIAPAVIWAFNRQPYMVIAASIICYAAAQIFPWFNLPGGSPGGDFQWNFNPMAWQILFFGGILAGDRRVLTAVFNWLERGGYRPLIVLVVLVSVSVLHETRLTGFIPKMWREKETIGLVRIAHTFLVILSLSAILVIAKSYLRTAPARLVALCGRQTLHCYTATIPATYALAAFWLVTGKSYIGYLASAVAIVATVIVVAQVTERVRKSSKPVQNAELPPFDPSPA